MNSMNLTAVDEAIASALATYEPQVSLPLDDIIAAAEQGRRHPRYDAIMVEVGLSTSASTLYRELHAMQSSSPAPEVSRWVEGIKEIPQRIADQLRTLFATPAFVPVYRSNESETTLPIDPANQTLKPGALDGLQEAEIRINGAVVEADASVNEGDVVEATYFVANDDDWVAGQTKVVACFMTMSADEAFDLAWAEAAAEEAPVISAMLMYRSGRFGQAEALLERWPADEYLAPYAQAVRGSASARRRDAGTLLD